MDLCSLMQAICSLVQSHCFVPTNVMHATKAKDNDVFGFRSVHHDCGDETVRLHLLTNSLHERAEIHGPTLRNSDSSTSFCKFLSLQSVCL